MYNVDFNKLIDLLLPTRKRKPKRRVWLRSLISPINYLKGLFDTFRADIDYKIKITGQVVYLQRALNDAFDIGQRRITIDDSIKQQSTKLYIRAAWDDLQESEKVFLYRRDDASVEIYRRIQTSDAGGFVVNVPFSLTDPQYYRMYALINFYKLAGKQFIINQY